MDKKLEQSHIDAEAIKLVQDEVTQFKNSTFQVTNKVSFNMRPLIEKCRKNYWGIFDSPKDKNTGRPKQWVPLTRVLVDGAYKNSDVDSKDTNFRGTTKIGRLWSPLIRGYMRRWLDGMYYGEMIDQDRLQMIIDGTVVWKTVVRKVKGKTKVEKHTVDLLNCFIDPTAKSIQTAYRFTERSLMTVSEIKAMDWRNTDVEAMTRKPKEAGMESVLSPYSMVDVYEMWGKGPRKLLTGNLEDTDEVDLHVVISGIDGGTSVVHVIEENSTTDRQGNIIKPYEEGWYMKVPGRWYGVGIPEMVLYLQEWINLVVNLRINKNTLAQLGILKWRSADKDLSQQMVSSLVSSGILKVSDKDDLTSLDIQPAGQDSYTDEENVRQWSQQVTSIFDVNMGAPLPASTSATGAAIQDAHGKSAFVMVKEAWGQFQTRWLERHVMPHVAQMMKEEKWTTVFGDFDNVDRVREGVVAFYAMQLLEEQYAKGNVPDEASMQEAIQKAEIQLRRDGDLFFKVLDEVVTDGVTVQVFFTNEEVDTSVTVRNLIDLANVLQDQQVKNDFVASALDLLGIPVPQSLYQSQPVQPTMARGTLDTMMNQQQLTTDANTMPSTAAPMAL
jgi:hypothetical protein